MVAKSAKIWLDGQYLDWDAAQVHILTHTLHYGFGAYEGVRAYKLTDGRSGVFRLRDHIHRLMQTLKLLKLKIPYSEEELCARSVELLQRNRQPEGYLRPLVFVGDGAMGLYAVDNPTRTALVTWEWGAYLGRDGLENGIRARVSSLRRLSMNSTLNKGKVIGHYVNNIMAKREAMADGYQEAIMLDERGYVAEASGENIFIVKDGVLKTPPYSAAILAGITRDSVMKLARGLGLEVVEQVFARDEMYLADEMFLTGTAAEITPVREVDGVPIGPGTKGPITGRIQERFFAVVRGEVPDYHSWLTFYRLD
jgi:branched-chain amino acid aminotransferase